MDARTIVDTGFLVALLLSTDEQHSWAIKTLPKARGPWLTCEACISEAAFLLGSEAGASAVLDVYQMMERGQLISQHLLPEHLSSVIAETARYRKRQVDFADACLVALSDMHPRLPVVTLDKNDFAVYFRGRLARKVITP